MITSSRGLSFDRVVFFSDAVFAFAITLLLIDLRPPNVPAPEFEAALRAFFGQPGPFVATAIGFLVVGSYWMSHRGVFALIGRTDGLVVWANLIFLFWVAIQPFFTAALAEHDPNTTSVVAYASCQVFAGLAQLALWGSAAGRGLLAPWTSAAQKRYVTVQLLRAPIVFGASIPVTLLAGPSAGMASWAGVLLLALVIRGAFRATPGGAAIATTPGGQLPAAPAR
jgi:TMEM175 potassium channel family protein